jgi:hypothetical protein
MSVGAAGFLQTPGYGVSPALLRDYSSWGVQPLYYDAKGVRLTTPTVSHPSLADAVPADRLGLEMINLNE